MEEQSKLQSLGVTGEWIWGDDDETEVQAQAFGLGRNIIFSFAMDNKEPATSLANRLVTCYHDRPYSNPDETFRDEVEMRGALWTTIADIWPVCTKHPAIASPDVVVRIYGDPQPRWRICHESIFSEYLDLLSPLEVRACSHDKTVSFEMLERKQQLGGRGCTTLVRVLDDRNGPDTTRVFKGVDFRVFLNTYQDGFIAEEVKTFYHSLDLVRKMPPHPNITAPTDTLVTIHRPGSQEVLVCGCLFPYYPNGDLASLIEKSNAASKRLPVSKKALWCYQMSAALAHTHLVAHEYHMDVKPGNFLLDADQNLLLTDWEQSDAPVTTAAPEVDGTWDVEEVPSQGSVDTRLQYTKYTGPERRNMPENTPGSSGWNTWNVYPVWQKHCPKALELAEVFSLGRSMWMLLRQPDMDFDDVETTLDVVEDWEQCDDLPASWKQFVDRCLARDAPDRPRMEELVKFWQGAKDGVHV